MVDYSSVAEVENRGNKCLLMKLLTFKYYNREVLKRKSLRFYNMSESLIMAEFKLDSDKIRVP